MKDHNVKQYPITLTGMGGGVGSPRLHTAGGGSGGSGWPFDLSTASFNGKAAHYRYTHIVNSTTTGFFLKPDGTAFYTMHSSDDKVRKHTMSTAWDITTCSYNSVSSSGLYHSYTGGPCKGLYFKSDGTKLFYVDSTHIRAYNLSSAWDITTLSAASDSHDFSSNLASSVTSVNFKPDGTKFYISETGGSTNNSILEYNLSTAWDLSTASYVHKDTSGLLDAATTNDVRGFAFGNSGGYVQISSNANTYGRRLSLSTPWDISTLTTAGATWTQHYQITSGFSGYGLNWQWKSDGLQYYFMGGSDEDIHEMKPQTAWIVGNANTGSENDFKNTAYYVDSCQPRRLFNINSTHSVRWVDDGNKLAFNASGTTTYLYSAGTPYDMKTLTDVGKTYGYTTDDGTSGSAYEVTYNSTGTVLFWGPSSTKKVRQFSLSTPWNASTINSTAVHTLDLTAGGGPSNVNCGTVSDDGKYIYAVQSTVIHQWTLSTPFDLSTASYTNNKNNVVTATVQYIKISPDGTQIICMKSTELKSYTLSTAWDITTITYDNKSFILDTNLSTMIPSGFGWNAGMHIVPSGKITFMPYYGAIGISISFS